MRLAALGAAGGAVRDAQSSLLGIKGMMFGLTTNAEEEMYKELFLGMIDGSIASDVDDSSVLEVRDYAFYNCYTLGNVNLPNVRSVGAYGFAQYTRKAESHTHVVRLQSCESLGNNAFYLRGRNTAGADGVSGGEIYLPSVKTIGGSCFLYSGFKTIDIGEHITSIGATAFAGAELITSEFQTVIIRAAIAPTIPANAFTANANAKLVFTALTRAQVESIPNYPFNIKKFQSSDDEWTLA